MKKIILTCIILISFSISINAQTRKKEEFKMKTDQSILNWKGSSLFNFGEHYGTVLFKEGHLKITNGRISGGKFIIDMNTIVNTDGEYSEGLVMHLKDKDFFDVFNYLTSMLEITQVSYIDDTTVEISADLTIKGITKPIEFSGKINSNKGELSTKFIIDRTRWGVVFASKSITSVKDHILSDAIEFEAKLYF
ncbi:YceI family protein [Dokdonia sp.]|uniref:YceI family protein n=1 Tax=Dokdonia sp. TaxID=2024995 RepID=UPI0032640EB4